MVLHRERMTRDPHTPNQQFIRVSRRVQVALQRMSQTHKRRDRRKTKGKRAGNRIRVLHPQMFE
nr:hypothetical protein [Thiothrix unzii]